MATLNERADEFIKEAMEVNADEMHKQREVLNNLYRMKRCTHVWTTHGSNYMCCRGCGILLKRD